MAKRYPFWPTFVIHYTPDLFRREFILRQFQLQNITDYQFITKYDREVIPIGLHQCFTELTTKEVSIFLKHLSCYQIMCLDTSDKYKHGALIIEDDTLLIPDFTFKVQQYVSQIPQQWDFVSLSAGDNHWIVAQGDLVDGKNTYLQQTDFLQFATSITRGLDNYLISKEFASSIYRNFYCLLPYFTPIDIFVGNYALATEARLYWVHPVLALAGSSLGLLQQTYDSDSRKKIDLILDTFDWSSVKFQSNSNSDINTIAYKKKVDKCVRVIKSKLAMGLKSHNNGFP